MYIKADIMIVINPTELRTNQKKYFDLAETEKVLVKRGRKLIELKVTESISPSNDPYFDNVENILKLFENIKNANIDIENNETTIIKDPKNIWESIQ
jgi:hypothetical protein